MGHVRLLLMALCVPVGYWYWQCSERVQGCPPFRPNSRYSSVLIPSFSRGRRPVSSPCPLFAAPRHRKDLDLCRKEEHSATNSQAQHPRATSPNNPPWLTRASALLRHFLSVPGDMKANSPVLRSSQRRLPQLSPQRSLHGSHTSFAFKNPP